MTAMEPGIYEMSADEYHARPELSSSGARKLLPPHTPAQFAYERRHPQAPTDEMVFGSAVHTKVLGAGAEIEIVEAKNWTTNAAKEAKAAAVAAGKIPLLRKDNDRADEMAATVRNHPLAAALLAAGRPEQAIFWADPETGVQCRALIDWLGETDGGLLFATDYKTCVSADLDKISKAVYEYGYHIQSAWYKGGLRALNLAQRVKFVFIFQSKQPPYLVNVIELDPEAQAAGEHYARVARLTYRDCTEANEWPGYRTDYIELVGLPGYALTRYYEEVGK